jgi:hypothetical protein
MEEFCFQVTVEPFNHVSGERDLILLETLLDFFCDLIPTLTKRFDHCSPFIGQDYQFGLLVRRIPFENNHSVANQAENVRPHLLS